MISQRFPEFQLMDKLNLLPGRDGRTPIITYRRRKHKLPSKDKEGSLNSLCSQSVNSLILTDYHMERQIRSSGPPEEVVKDNGQLWEGPQSVRRTIKGRATSSGEGVRNWERLSRGEEELSKGPRIPVLLRSTPAIQVIRLRTDSFFHRSGSNSHGRYWTRRGPSRRDHTDISGYLLHLGRRSCHKQVYGSS